MKNVILALSIIFFAFTVFRTNVFAPELFGYGRGIGIQAAGREIVFIYVDWGEERFLFLMIGAKNGSAYSGRIYQLLGNRIASYPPFDCSTATAYCYARDARENWRGWIEFRGARRPFCGGQKIKSPCLKMEH